MTKKEQAPEAQPQLQGGLDVLLNPGSMAVIGASQDVNRIGGLVLDNALRNGFDPKRRIWRKIHLGIDEEPWRTMPSKSRITTSGMPLCCPFFCRKFRPISKSRQWRQMVHTIRATAMTPLRTVEYMLSSRPARMPGHGSQPPARNEAVLASKYLGRVLWRRWSRYHRQSRVEAKMHCLKLLGQCLMARDFDRQVAEIQIRVAVLNGYTALGIPDTLPQAKSARGKGKLTLN